MARYRLHGFMQSGNVYKIALYLQCAGLEWEPVVVEVFGGEARSAAWRASVNEMGEVPVLEAEGRKLTQSGAILTWLADHTGRFAPQTADEREEVLRWILYDNYRFTNYIATRRFLKCFGPEAPHPAVLDFFKMRADGALGVVDTHLATRRFMLGDRVTVADFSLVGYLFFPQEETGYDLAVSHPHIHAWRERMTALPGWKHPSSVKNGVVS
ncbi:MAG: glutathione S-transferase family protein [Hyphomicrobium sp.]